MAQSSSFITGYNELTSPQFLDDNGWRELVFDLSSEQNILQENLSIPEAGGGFVYRDAKVVGSATQNRFLYWRIVNDLLELVELSTEVDLDGNQVRMKFTNSPVLNSVNVIELSDSIILLVATLNSVHRLYLPHPKTTNKSVLSDLTIDVLFDPNNYFLLTATNSYHSHNQSASIHVSQQPICSTSWVDRKLLKFALALPNSSILIVQFNLSNVTPYPITTSEIKQIGIIGRIWSRMPNLLNKSTNDCDNAVFSCLPYYSIETQEVLLVALCRDMKIRLFSTNTKECVSTLAITPQSSFSQSIVSHNNATTEQPVMKMYGNKLYIYMSENPQHSEFLVCSYSYEEGTHQLNEIVSIRSPSWEKLVDFTVTESRIWALGRAVEASLFYIELNQIFDPAYDPEEAIWDHIELADDFEESDVKNYVAEIFWRNRFSVATIQKALIGIKGPSIPKKNTLEELEELAFTNIIDENQEDAWARFYSYCIQNHSVSNKNIGLVSSEDECVISLIKRNNPSFICPRITSTDKIIQKSTYRAIETPPEDMALIESLNYISEDLLDYESGNLIEERLFKDPANIGTVIGEVIKTLLDVKKINLSKLNFKKSTLLASFDNICKQIDLTNQAQEYGLKVLSDSVSKFSNKHNSLESNCGIMIVADSFKSFARARMNLARDLLIYVHLVNIYSDSKKPSEHPLKELIAGICNSERLEEVLTLLRSYSILVWIADSQIKSSKPLNNLEVIDHIANKFNFFKKLNTRLRNQKDSATENIILQNLLMNFLYNGGYNYSTTSASNFDKTLSNSLYISEVTLNLSKLLWPKSRHLCLAEFLLTHQLDEQLMKYLDLLEIWLSECSHDRDFMRAVNCLIQNRSSQSVKIFSELWTYVVHSRMIGRFAGLEMENLESATKDSIEINPSLIYRYYDKLIQLFQVYNDQQCLVAIINHCLCLLDQDVDKDQRQWVNSLRAKLFQYLLELEDSDEAYHTMVLVTDTALRTNCLRKFIVSHCEKQQWSKFLSYPYIDIKDDFIDILVQKAESSDLSKLDEKEFYKTSYYDLLFATYVSDDEYRLAANVMYNYAQRLACEVPGMVSIRKQADCLLVALNALKCVEPSEAYVDAKIITITQDNDNKNGFLKRSYDCDSESSSEHHIQENGNNTTSGSPTRIYIKDLDRKYELTKARSKLLDKDPTGNAIALSPLTAEETISHMARSNMFSAALDLAVLMKVPMEPILEGLAAKYIILLGRTKNIDLYSDLEKELSDIFTHSYSSIETYNYIENSTSSIIEKIWRLIDYYLIKYDGISHTYSTDQFASTFSGSTVLMKVVASKILAAGHDVPASLKRMYMSRNTPELLRILIKYDKLPEAADLATEMIDIILDPSNAYASHLSEPPAIYLPTHLILSLIQFLNEDATNTDYIKISDALVQKLNKFRFFVKSS